MFETLM